MDVTVASDTLHRVSRSHTPRIVGRNRYNACKLAKVEPHYSTWEGKPEELIPYVLSKNLHRRHLNESQRAMIAAKLANFKHGGKRRGSQEINWSLEPVTQEQAAELLHVSPMTVKHARSVRNTLKMGHRAPLTRA